MGRGRGWGEMFPSLDGVGGKGGVSCSPRPYAGEGSGVRELPCGVLNYKDKKGIVNGIISKSDSGYFSELM